MNYQTCFTRNMVKHFWSAHFLSILGQFWMFWNQSNSFISLAWLMLSYCIYNNSLEHSILLLNFYSKFHQIYLEPKLESLLDELMCSCDQTQTINMAKIISNFWTENPTGSSCIDSPIFDVFRIWPHKIAEWTFMRNLYFSIYSSNLINSFNLGTQTSVDTEYLI